MKNKPLISIIIGVILFIIIVFIGINNTYSQQSNIRGQVAWEDIVDFLKATDIRILISDSLIAFVAKDFIDFTGDSIRMDTLLADWATIGNLFITDSLNMNDIIFIQNDGKFGINTAPTYDAFLRIAGETGVDSFALALGSGSDSDDGWGFIGGGLRFEIHNPTLKDTTGGLYLDNSLSTLVWSAGDSNFYSILLGDYEDGAFTGFPDTVQSWISDSTMLFFAQVTESDTHETVIAVQNVGVICGTKLVLVDSLGFTMNVDSNLVIYNGGRNALLSMTLGLSLIETDGAALFAAYFRHNLDTLETTEIDRNLVNNAVGALNISFAGIIADQDSFGIMIENEDGTQNVTITHTVWSFFARVFR